MGFTLKSTKKMLSRLGSSRSKRRNGASEQDENDTPKQLMSMMADNNGNYSQQSLMGGKSRPSYMRSASAKRLLSSFNLSRRGPAHSTRQHRRASIETAKISSLDFQSSRLYHNDSDMEDFSHSSYSEGGASLTQPSKRRTSFGLCSSPPPVRIVEGNSSEEFSSGSIRARNAILAASQAQSPKTEMEGDRDYLEPLVDSADETEIFSNVDDADETERRSNVSEDYLLAAPPQDEQTSSPAVTFDEKVLPVIVPLNDEGEEHDASPLVLPTYHRPKRASGSSDDISNISDEDEEEDQFGELAGCGTAHNDISRHLDFVASDLRADYLLLYEFLQEEALLASIQDETWRTQVRSARLRSNTRQYLSMINQ